MRVGAFKKYGLIAPPLINCTDKLFYLCIVINLAAEIKVLINLLGSYEKQALQVT